MMHSCDVSAAPPPAQGEALLLELGRLIVVGRGGQPLGHHHQHKLKTPSIPEPQPATSILPTQQASIPTQQYHQPAALNQPPLSQQQQQQILNQPLNLIQSSSGQQSPSVLHQQSLLHHQLQQSGENDVDGGAHRRILASKALGSLAAAKVRVAEDIDNKMPSTSTSGQSSHASVTGASLYEGNARRALKGHAESLWKEHIPFCIEVLLAPECGVCRTPLVLLERWTMSVYYTRAPDPSNHITSQWLLNAVRSQLHFSQISAWSAKLCPKAVPPNATKREPSPAERQRKLSRETCNIKKYEANVDHEEDEEVVNEGNIGIGEARNRPPNGKLNVMYSLKIPGETFEIADFQCTPVKHVFPVTDIGSNVYLKVMFESLPRMEDVPLICCGCDGTSANSPATLKRRRSKDLMAPGNAFSEDVLASTLAAACTVAEVQAYTKVFSTGYRYNPSRDLAGRSLLESRVKGATFSPDLGIINPDKGCASGISRKFYSTPETPDRVAYHAAPSSRGSTPDRGDFNDSGIAACTNNPASAPLCDRPPQACKRKSKHTDGSYPFQAPSDGEIVNYVLLDDRMQTPCRQKGKHRCNCDDESDQGQGKDSGVPNREESKSGIVLDERRIKQIAKYMRRARKEERVNRMRESGLSSQENSECASDCGPPGCVSDGKTDLNININSKINSKSDYGTAAVSRNSERDRALRSSPELVHYYGYGHSHQSRACLSCERSSDSNRTSKSKDPAVYNKNSQKTVDSSTATSIPILQASRFDHVNRFGSFRSGVTLHGAMSSRDAVRDADCVCSSAGCDQMASVKSFREHDRDGPVRTRSVQCQTAFCNLADDSRFRNSDDSYRPSVKKLISSHTQTEAFHCDCGKPLRTECSDCAGSRVTGNGDEEKENDFRASRMKRSKASHDLAGVNKSDLLLEAMERTGRLSRSDAETDAALEDRSENNNCDNRNRAINKCECDKNIVYYNNVSAYRDASRGQLLLSDKFVEDFSSNNTNNDEDLRRCDDNTTNQHENAETTKPKEPPNREIKSVYRCIAEGLDRTVDFIRKPRLKRLAPIMDRLDKIVTERHEQKSKANGRIEDGRENGSDRHLNEFPDEEEDILYKDEESGITYMKSPHKGEAANVWQQKTVTKKQENNNTSDENYFIVYEKGLYGNFGTSNSNNKRNITDVDGSSTQHARDRSGSRINSDVVDTDIDAPSSSSDFLLHRREFSAIDAQMLCERVARSQSLGFDHSVVVPSVTEMDRFRCRLDSAASMVFHSRTGLPLTSSPAPLRRGKSCFDYDSSINSVSGIKSALYGLDPDSEGIESETGPSWSPGSSPGSPGRAPLEPPSFAFTSPISRAVAAHATVHSGSSSRSKFRHGASSGLLGSFEESVLNGRLEPAATVAGFTAEIGASGAFCPPHLKLPVTVFFYSLGDNTTSAPYLGHINLGRRGYYVPRAGTVQVTLFNPHGTVVKMFVVMYDLAGMPPNSRTFLRQRTLCLPAGAEPDPRCLRYLIHLRFLTSKSGKVYLHTDIRIIVSRKADLDTAAAHSLNPALAITRHIRKEEEENIDPLLTPALNLDQKTDKKHLTNGRCLNNIETGTFQRRSRKNSESPVRIFGGCDEAVMKRGGIDICNNVTIPCNNELKNDTSSLGRGIVLNDNETCGDRKRCSSIGAANTVNKELSYELRSFTYGPENPKYSPR